MTIEMERRGETQCQRENRQAGRATLEIFVTVLASALALSVSGLPLMGRLPAHAAEITFRCVNPASGTVWNLKIDDERQTADSLPAEITTTRIMWRDIVRGGFYELDRKSGLLTFRNASSTGGYTLYHRCHAN
jgi:hypothetical protein